MNYNQHTIPKYLYRYKLLIRQVHLWNRMVLLRNWHVYRKLKEILKEEKIIKVLDVGCGDGQHYLWIHRHYPHKQVFGLDKIPQNVNFCNYITKNQNCSEGNVEDFVFEPKADLILLIGLLDYIEDDVKGLINLRNSLADGGKILLYCPVNDVRIFEFYKRLKQKFNTYEKAQNRQRSYQETELFSLVEEADLKIVSKEFTMGKWGSITHELYASILILYEKSRFKIGILLLVYLLFPYLLLFNWMDFRKNKKTGNGVLLVLEK